MTAGGGRSRYCVIIPAFDAAATIGDLVRGVRAKQFDVVVIDDGSRDGTAHTAEAAGAVVISHPSNLGKGAALRTGFQYALRKDYDGVITMDADGQHVPDDLGGLIEAGDRVGVHVVVGDRMGHERTMPLLRRWTNRAMSSIVSWVIRQPVPDSQCGFRLLRKEVLASTPLATSHFDIETEVLLAAVREGWTIASTPIQTIYDRHPSHIRPIRDGLRFIQLICRYLGSRRTARPRDESR